MRDARETALALGFIAEGLQGITGGEHHVGGPGVVGPGTSAVVLAEHPEVLETERTAHLDLGFVLNTARQDSTIWDCASGFGSTRDEAITSAAQAWLRTTAPVIVELMTGQGTFADHYSSLECGLAGRHVIHGPILGWGASDGPDALQSWWLAHPVLPTLTPVLRPDEWPDLAAIRVFFGSQGGQDTAEVKVNGTVVPHANALLLQQDWPRTPRPAYVRSFLLAIPEHG